MKLILSLMLLALTFISSAHSEPVSFVAWNVEDYDFGGREPQNGSDGAIIATQLRDDFNGIDIFGLTEVHSESAMQVYATMAAADEDISYQYIFTRSGGWLRMGMIFNADRFDVINSQELDFGLSSVRTRFPLAVTFKDKTRDVTFVAVLVHLARGNSDVRELQARRLAEWAAENSEPVIAFGDFNFDYNVTNDSHNGGYSALLDSGYFSWLEPANRADTSWSGDIIDQYPDSILDFVFAGGEAKNWLYESFVYVRDGDFPDNSDTADHRPVVAVVEPAVGNALEPDFSYLLPKLNLDEVMVSELSAGAPSVTRVETTRPEALKSAQATLQGSKLEDFNLNGGSGSGGGGPTGEQLARLRSAAANYQSVLGELGYLTPDANPGDYPPSLLPYIRSEQREKFIQDLGLHGYITPDADPNDFPSSLLPYIRGLQNRPLLDGDNGR